MLEGIKEFIIKLNEEVRYHENILEHQKRLESTLWGLEEQTTFPENSASEDQTELGEETNKCRVKILNCTKLLSSHNQRMLEVIKEFYDNSK